MYPTRQLDDEEMTERSLMMRVFSIRFRGDDFYPRELVNGSAAMLVDKGWIEEFEGGYRSTHKGDYEWAQLNRDILQHKYNSNSALVHEIRRILEEGPIDMKSTICKADGCGQPRQMNDKGHLYSYCAEHQRAHMQQKLEVAKHPSATGKRKIRKPNVLPDVPPVAGGTQPGDLLVMQRTTPVPPRPRVALINQDGIIAQAYFADDVPPPAPIFPSVSQTAAPRLIDTYLPPETTNEWIHAPLPLDPPAAAEPCADACADCVYKDVVDLLAKRLPGVVDIVAGVKAIRK